MTVADHDNQNFANYWKCLTESLLIFKTAKEILTKIVNAIWLYLANKHTHYYIWLNLYMLINQESYHIFRF